jgi:hypothetical protein
MFKFRKSFFIEIQPTLSRTLLHFEMTGKHTEKQKIKDQKKEENL